MAADAAADAIAWKVKLVLWVESHGLRPYQAALPLPKPPHSGGWVMAIYPCPRLRGQHG
jgi:hypothetical protein